MLQRKLRTAFVRFVDWKRENNIQATQGRFTCARVNRRMRSTFACMNTKAVTGKRISYWLASEATSWAQRRGASEVDRLVATTAWAYRDFLQLLDECPFVLSSRQAEAIYAAGHLHLLSYASLRRISAGVQGAHAPNRSLWCLLPKHHFLLHELRNMRATRINCRHYTLLTGESFIGNVSRMARLCHRSSVSKRVAQRWKAKLSMRVVSRFGWRL